MKIAFIALSCIVDSITFVNHSQEGKTALMCAVASDCADCVRLLGNDIVDEAHDDDDHEADDPEDGFHTCGGSFDD